MSNVGSLQFYGKSVNRKSRKSHTMNCTFYHKINLNRNNTEFYQYFDHRTLSYSLCIFNFFFINGMNLHYCTFVLLSELVLILGPLHIKQSRDLTFCYDWKHFLLLQHVSSAVNIVQKS